MLFRLRCLGSDLGDPSNQSQFGDELLQEHVSDIFCGIFFLPFSLRSHFIALPPMSSLGQEIGTAALARRRAALVAFPSRSVVKHDRGARPYNRDSSPNPNPLQ
jgi:hypothetical protein